MKFFNLLLFLYAFPLIHIEYPSNIHQEMITYVEQTSNEFLLNYDDGNQLYITFEKYQSNYESYLCYVAKDFKGAHPITNLKTFNYFENEYVHLDDYFTEENYRYFCLEAKRILMPQLKEEGIQPKKENYENIILYGDYYFIFFEHYQVAPYGAGIQLLKVKRK